MYRNFTILNIISKCSLTGDCPNTGVVTLLS